MTKPVQIKGLEIGKGMPKICVPLTAVTREELCEEAENAREAQPDLVEWRADYYEDLFEISKTVEMLEQLKEILGDIPLLFTIRTKAEGGNAAISMKDYTEINLAAAVQGKAELVDVEAFSEDIISANIGDSMNLKIIPEKVRLIEKIHETGTKVIASSHDFDKTDSREILLNRFQEMDKSGADILKMAVMPVSTDDVKAIMEVTDKMRREFTDRPIVSMSMGELGAISRVEGEIFGSSITFATVGAASAPGQIPIVLLKTKIEEVRNKLQK